MYQRYATSCVCGAFALNCFFVKISLFLLEPKFISSGSGVILSYCTMLLACLVLHELQE